MIVVHARSFVHDYLKYLLNETMSFIYYFVRIKLTIAELTPYTYFMYHHCVSGFLHTFTSRLKHMRWDFQSLCV